MRKRPPASGVPRYRTVRWLARRLPSRIYRRVFEPAFDDACREGIAPWRAALLVAECYRIALVDSFRTRSTRLQADPSVCGEGAPPDMPKATMMDPLTQDVRFAARMLIKNPGFTSVAVLALSLGIGANASIFSLIYGLFVRPLPYEQSERLVRLWGQSVDGRLNQIGASVPKFQHIRDHQQMASAVAADFGLAMSMTGGDEPLRVTATSVTSNYFDVLGVTPIAGRGFRAEEEDRADVAVVTRRFWVNRLQSDPGVLGRAIVLDGRPYTIVGVVPVMPASDVGPSDIFLPHPIGLSALTPELRQRGVSYLRLTARLKPGVTVEQARAEAALLGESYQQANREKADSAWHERLVPIREDLTGNVRPAILTLLAAVALVLLIACSNVANLLTARFAGRRREIALRGALGAERGRIVRLFVVESLLLSVAGAAGGLGVAAACLQALPSIGAANLPLDADVTITPPVLWTTMAVAMLTGLLMGIYPAYQAACPAPSEVLKEGGRGVSGTRSQHRVRSLLVAGQVALSLMLMVGAALLITSFSKLQHQEPGFDATHVLTVNIALPAARYPGEPAQSRFRDRLLDELRATPGVRAAAMIAGLPLTGNNSNAPFARGDGDVPPLNERPLGLTRSITPGYFNALSIPIVAGRDFAAGDRADAPQVIILSANTARKLFPDVDPLGRTVFTGSLGGGTRAQVVGIVGDVRSVSLAQTNDVEFYRPYTQRPNAFMQVAVRTDGDAMVSLNALRAAVRSVDPQLPLNQPTTLSAVADASLGQRKLLMALLGLFAGLALLLATVGIYSVVAYLVGQRTNEIGIRLALGARRLDVVRMVTWQGLRPVAAGLAAGLAGVFALGRLLASQLYGVSVLDPSTLAAATLVLGAVALLACLVPAGRATRVDPMIALRTE